jgi:hypothetical protein
LAKIEESIQKELEVDKICQDKHLVLTNLSSQIEGIPQAINNFHEFILVNGDKIRKYDHLTHTLKTVSALTNLLSMMNLEIDDCVGCQTKLYERITIPMIDLIGNEAQLKKYEKHCFEFRTAAPALQAVNDILHDLLLRQMKLLDELVKQLGEKLIAIVEQIQPISRTALFGLHIVARTIPRESVKQRIAMVVSGLGEDDLIYLHSLLSPNELPFLSQTITQRASVIAKVPAARIAKLVQNKSLEWVFLIADSNIFESSDEDDIDAVAQSFLNFNCQ